MSEAMFLSGSCVACREYHADLRGWKPVIFGERWFVWLCQPCRNLPDHELATRIEFNLENLPILPDERLITRRRRPSEAELAELWLVAELARDVLRELDAMEGSSDGD